MLDIDDESARESVLRFGSKAHGRSFTIPRAELSDDSLHLEIVGMYGSGTAWLRVALPRSGRDQYWLYVRPDDAEDWAGQLFIWMEEEVATGGLGDSRRRAERDGRSYVIPVSYGWQRSNETEHKRGLASCPPDGWYGPLDELLH